MKSFIAILIIFAPLAFASAKGSIQDRNSLEDTAFRKAERLQRALNRNIIDMSDQEIISANKHMTKALQVIQGQNIGGGSDFIASVRIEDTSMTIEAQSIEGFISQCEVKAQSLRVSSVDDIAASISGGPTKSLHKQHGYLRSANAQCVTAAKLLIDSADSKGVSVSSAKYLASGIVEGVGLIASGDSLGELEKSCLANLKSIPSSVDDISMKMNGSQPKKAHKQHGYWRTKQEICSQAISLVF